MRREFVILVSLFICATCVYSQNNKHIDYTKIKIENYRQGVKMMPIFVPLEIGEIKPEGWLLDWAKTAAKGITGHLDEYQNVFKYGWKPFGYTAMGSKSDGTGWALEQSSYWLDGAVKLGYMLNDPALIRKTNARLDSIINGVLKGGDTFIYWKSKDIFKEYFNCWAHGLMGRVLISYYQATHRPDVLAALEKVYYNFQIPYKRGVGQGLSGGMDDMRSNTNIDAMTETYLFTGNKAILDSIEQFANRPNIDTFENKWLALNPANLMNEETTIHGVTFYEMLRIPAIISMWTGKEKGLQASEHLISWAEKKCMQPYGVCSSEEYLSGIGGYHNTETCNVPTSMWSFSWLLRLTGQSNWGDKIERVFFNAGPAPIERDFKTMCYYQSPNRFSTSLPAQPNTPGEACLKFTPYGHKVLCCVGNVNNTIPDYIQNMCMATMDNGLAFTLYGPCSISKNINKIDVKMKCVTSYPFNDKININMAVNAPVNMPLYFRIPQWCSHPVIMINAKKIMVKVNNGFAKVTKEWKNGDKIVLIFPMQAKVTKGYETPYPQVKYFLKGSKAIADTTVHNPYAYVTYGPLLFSYDIKDINANTPAAGAKYNYALNVLPLQANSQIKVLHRAMPAKWSWQLNDAPVVLQVKAKEINWTPNEMHSLPSSPVLKGKDTTIQLIPYGCTKFRLTMFPVTASMWK